MEVRLCIEVLLGEIAGVLILLVIGRTGKKGAELAPLHHKGRPAVIAFLIRRDLHALQVFHVLGGFAELLLEVAVEALQQRRPLLLAELDVI